MSIVAEKYRAADDVSRQERERFRLGANIELGEEDEIAALLPADRSIWGSLTAIEDGPSDGDPVFGWYLVGDVSTLESDDYEDAYGWLTLDHGNALLTIGGSGLEVTLFGLVAGDLLYADADPKLARLAHGGEGTVLRAAASPGLAWTTATFPDTVTQGGILHGSASNVWSVLAVGAADRVLTSSGTLPQWSATIAFSALPTGSGTWSFGANEAVTLQGRLVTTATTATRAGLNLPHGVAPSAPVNGDLWTETTAVYAHVNGATVDLTAGFTSPLGPTDGGTGLATLAKGDLLIGSATDTWAALALSATDGALLRANTSTGLPEWTTSRYPNTVTAGRILYANAANFVTGLAQGAANTVLTSDGSFPVYVANIAFGALPTGTGQWSATQITVNATVLFPGVVNVQAAGLLRLSPRTAPGSPTNGDLFLGTDDELYLEAGGVTYTINKTAV